MISIEMSPEQFAKVEEVIKNEHPEAKLDSTGENVGHIHTKQIDADYKYVPRDNDQGTLVFENEVKHGLYGLVSDETIGAHLSSLLGDIKVDPKEVPQAAKVEDVKINEDTKAQNNFVKPAIQA